MRRVALVLFLLIATNSVARGELAKWALLATPDATQEAFRNSPAATMALERILTRGIVDRERLGRVLRNPYVSPHVVEAVTALEKVQHIPGVDRVLRRLEMDEAYSDPRTRGPVFELQVAATLGARVKEISADVDGHEVDALLHDGTVVEAKQLDEDPDIAEKQLTKAVQQLELRRGGGRKVMLVLSKPHSAEFMAHFQTKFGKDGAIVRIPFRVHPRAMLPPPSPGHQAPQGKAPAPVLLGSPKGSGAAPQRSPVVRVNRGPNGARPRK
jgi:hypothetical protein